MPKTQVRTTNIEDQGVRRADLNVGTVGSAVIAKLIAGGGVSLSSTGADSGTGDVTLGITVAGVTLAMMADRAQSTFIGRAAAAGTGVPQELTKAQAQTILDLSGVNTGDQSLAGLASLTATQTFTGVNTFSPIARSSSIASYFTLTMPADTGITGSFESIGVNFTANTRTFAAGTVGLQRERVFAPPTYASSGATTFTTAVNVEILNPIQGGGATFTNRYALYTEDVRATSITTPQNTTTGNIRAGLLEFQNWGTVNSHVFHNIYRDVAGGVFKYRTTASGAGFYINPDQQISFYFFPSGTAGNTATPQSSFRMEPSGLVGFGGLGTINGVFYGAMAVSGININISAGRGGTFADLGIWRSTNAELEVNGGTAGTLRDVKLRNLRPGVGTALFTSGLGDPNGAAMSITTTTGSPIVTITGGYSFNQGDVGKSMVGPLILAGATIISVTSGLIATLSSNIQSPGGATTATISVIANPGSLYTNTFGGLGTLWIKETGSGTSTGWAQITNGSTFRPAPPTEDSLAAAATLDLTVFEDIAPDDTIASASTLDLSSFESPYVNVIQVTGTTGIGAITLADGFSHLLQFAGAVTITPTVLPDQTLVTPGDVPLLTVANSWYTVEAIEGSVIVSGPVGYVYTKQVLEVTGTTPITAITINDGLAHTLKFTGVTTITPDANLLTPGGAPITTKAGDWAVASADDTGVVTIQSYQTDTGYSTQTFDNIYMNPFSNIGFPEITAGSFDIGRTGSAFSGNFLKFEGGTWVALYEQDSSGVAELRTSSLTGFRTFQFPDHDGTFATQAGTESLTNKKLGSLTTNGIVRTSGGDGTLSVDTTVYGTGTVTNFSAGDLSPLFTTSEATTTTTPALTFSLSTAAANTFFGNGTGSTAAPTFMSASTARTALGLVIGTNVQAYDADLTTWAGITPGSGVATFLATPSSANLLAAVTGPTGTGALVFGTIPTLSTPVINGIPTGTGVSAANTPDTLVLRDEFGDIYAGAVTGVNFYADTIEVNAVVEGISIFAASGTPVNLAYPGPSKQFVTGTNTSQTFNLPTSGSLPLGYTWLLKNLMTGTGTLIILTSGGNTLLTLAPGTAAYVTCRDNSGTGTSSWGATYFGTVITTAKKLTVTQSLTLAGTDTTTHTFPSTSCSVARIDASQTFAEAADFAFGTTTGSKIGTSVSQKIAFHNATAVIQRAGAAQAAVATTAATNVTPYGFTTAAQADAIITLLNEIRAMAVEKGLMKGAA